MAREDLIGKMCLLWDSGASVTIDKVVSILEDSDSELSSIYTYNTPSSMYQCAKPISDFKSIEELSGYILGLYRQTWSSDDY